MSDSFNDIVAISKKGYKNYAVKTADGIVIDVNKEAYEMIKYFDIEITKLKQENKQLKEKNEGLIDFSCPLNCKLLIAHITRIDKAIDTLYLYGETLNPEFQQTMLKILASDE